MRLHASLLVAGTMFAGCQSNPLYEGDRDGFARMVEVMAPIEIRLSDHRARARSGPSSAPAPMRPAPMPKPAVGKPAPLTLEDPPPKLASPAPLKPEPRPAPAKPAGLRLDDRPPPAEAGSRQRQPAPKPEPLKLDDAPPPAAPKPQPPAPAPAPAPTPDYRPAPAAKPAPIDRPAPPPVVDEPAPSPAPLELDRNQDEPPPQEPLANDDPLNLDDEPEDEAKPIADEGPKGPTARERGRRLIKRSNKVTKPTNTPGAFTSQDGKMSDSSPTNIGAEPRPVGPRSADVERKLLASAYGDFAECYNDERLFQADAAGTAMIVIEVPNALPNAPRIETSPFSETMNACLLDAVRNLPFPGDPSGEPYIKRVPFNFLPD